jgi:hypothetical protein
MANIVMYSISIGKPTAIPKNSRHAYAGQGQDPLSGCPVGTHMHVPLSCTGVGIPTAIPEDHRQTLLGQEHVPFVTMQSSRSPQYGKGTRSLVMY